jgi:hypothetical protein
MDSLIAKLRVALQLDSAAFERGTRRAADATDDLGDRAEGAGRRLGQMGKALVAGAAAFAASDIVGQLASAVKGTLDYAGALDQMAKISNASIEEFQGLALAANSVGIENEKLSDILKDVNDKVGEFISTGGGEMKDFFENIAPKVGVTAEQFKNLSGPQSLQLYISSLEKAGLNQQQMTFYMEALADEATTLIPVMKNNGEAAKAFAEEARRAGIIITQDLADKSIAANAKIEALKKVLEGQWNIGITKHAGEIERMVTALAKMVDRFFDLIAAMERFANSPAGKLFIKAGSIASNVVNPLGIPAQAAGDYILGQGGGGGTAKPSKPMNLKGVTFGGPLKPGGTFKGGAGPLAQFAGGGLLGGGAANDLAGLDAGLLNHGSSILGVIQSMTEATEEAAEKTDVATVQIGRSFADMAQQTVASLQNLTGSIRSGDFLSILGSVLGLVTQLGSIGVFGKGVAGRLNAIPAYAGGTGFHPGGLAMVGERGPELVNLPRGTSVYPNGTGPGGGGRPLFFDLRGAVMTEHLLNQMNAIGAASAQAGGEIGYAKVARSSARNVGW